MSGNQSSGFDASRCPFDESELRFVIVVFGMDGLSGVVVSFGSGRLECCSGACVRSCDVEASESVLLLLSLLEFENQPILSVFAQSLFCSCVSDGTKVALNECTGQDGLFSTPHSPRVFGAESRIPRSRAHKMSSSRI